MKQFRSSLVRLCKLDLVFWFLFFLSPLSSLPSFLSPFSPCLPHSLSSSSSPTSKTQLCPLLCFWTFLKSKTCFSLYSLGDYFLFFYSLPDCIFFFFLVSFAVPFSLPNYSGIYYKHFLPLVKLKSSLKVVNSFLSQIQKYSLICKDGGCWRSKPEPMLAKQVFYYQESHTQSSTYPLLSRALCYAGHSSNHCTWVLMPIKSKLLMELCVHYLSRPLKIMWRGHRRLLDN